MMSEYECHVIKLLCLIATGRRHIDDSAYLLHLEKTVDRMLEEYKK